MLLHIASKDGKLEDVKLAIRMKGDVNAFDDVSVYFVPALLVLVSPGDLILFVF